jgi:hypothetical protein
MRRAAQTALAAAALGVLAVGFGGAWSGSALADTSTQVGRCSKAKATTVVKQLGLSDPAVASPVFKVLCGAFAGPGSETMVVSLVGQANSGMTDWVVLRRIGSAWLVLLKRHQAALLTAAGSDIKEEVSVFRAGDPRCCPSGGTKSRIWHWTGTRFTAGSWNRVEPASSPAPN